MSGSVTVGSIYTAGNITVGNIFTNNYLYSNGASIIYSITTAWQSNAAGLYATGVALGNQITAANTVVATLSANVGAFETYANSHFSTTTASVYNGSSSLSFASSGGNAVVQIGGVQTATFTQSSIAMIGNISATANVSGVNIVASSGVYSATINNTGNVAIGGFLTLSSAVQFANLTTSQISNITPTNRGMTVYNYTTGNIQVWTGTKWGNLVIS